MNTGWPRKTKEIDALLEEFGEYLNSCKSCRKKAEDIAVEIITWNEAKGVQGTMVIVQQLLLGLCALSKERSMRQSVTQYAHRTRGRKDTQRASGCAQSVSKGQIL